MLIVNAPPGFGMLWLLVAPLLSKRTSARVTVVGAGERVRLRGLLEGLMDLGQVPEEYGGSCRCAGPGGCWRQHPMEREIWALVEATTGLTTFRGFGGTSILILVGVATDSARRFASDLRMQQYDARLEDAYGSLGKKPGDKP
jgi:hypothetical protein